MKMTYESVALCPFCKHPVEICGRENHQDLGEIVLCICPHCGYRLSFSNEIKSFEHGAEADRTRPNHEGNDQRDNEIPN